MLHPKYKRFTNYCCCTGTVHCNYCKGQGKPPHLTVDKDYNTVLIQDSMNKTLLDFASTSKDGFYERAFKQINELEDMNEITQITTQESAFNVIKLQGYIIGSIDAQGNVSISNSPKVHLGPHSARTECARLAKINPGKAFFFTKMIGAEMVPNTFISI